ncbi:MAG: hypothetical protein OIF48_02575 [Silicimonas sp.]|nr:hypothetical protein [Silicimonas sp.]
MSLTLDPNAAANLTAEAIDARISFLLEDQVLEIDLSDLTLGNSADVNLLYDRIETKIAATGEDLWFFLINYKGTRIEPGAWFAHSRRGKDLNLAHSMGSVRHDACDETRRQIERNAGTDNFDPNLFADRGEALDHLRRLPSKRTEKIIHVPNYTVNFFRDRVCFDEEAHIMEIDLSQVTLAHSRDVNDCYDALDALIAETGLKWYFLINYENTKIFPGAWVQYAARGKALNEAGSLGSVRYAPGSETETDIRLRAESGGFRPNIRNTREEALERIEEMKRGES